MKKLSNFKDIQRFKEIAGILGIEFEDAQELSRVVNHAPTKELHEKVKRELRNADPATREPTPLDELLTLVSKYISDYQVNLQEQKKVEELLAVLIPLQWGHVATWKIDWYKPRLLITEDDGATFVYHLSQQSRASGF